jgi:hypothetical protein
MVERTFKSLYFSVERKWRDKRDKEREGTDK